MRATLIVFPPPCFDELFRLLPIEEPVGVQALASQGSVEAFNEGIVGGLVTTEVPTRQERLNRAKVARIQIDAGENASRIPSGEKTSIRGLCKAAICLFNPPIKDHRKR